jgi:hypothetical protein
MNGATMGNASINNGNISGKETKHMTDKPDDKGSIYLQGHIKIHDPSTGEVFVNKRNAIHYENFSEALALSVSNQGTGYVHEMVFGNGGSSVDPTGIITYLPTNTSGSSSALYSETYNKVVDANSLANPDPTRNYVQVRHTPGTTYSDILVTCLLDYGEPQGQAAFDNATNLGDTFVFDELGLKGYSANGVDTGKLLTHVVFHPIQKSLNRLIQVDYTVRIQTLTNLTSAA